MRTRMAHPRSVLLAAMAALILTGCTAADQQRWNEFWGLDKKPNSRKVKGKTPTARRNTTKRKATSSRTAKAGKKAEPTKAKPADKGDPVAIDAYATRMGSTQDDGYQPNDHTSKMRRQNDAQRRRRTPKVSEPPSDSPVRTASGGQTHESADKTATELPTAKTESAASTPDRNPVEMPTQTPILDKPTADAPASTETQPKIEPIEPPADPTPQVPAGGAAANSGAVRLPDPVEGAKAEDDAAEHAPVLTNVSVAAGTEPAAEPEASPAAATANKPAVTAEPVDTIIKRIADLRSRVTADPNNLEEQLRLRLLYLADKQDDKAIESIPGTDAEIEEIIQVEMSMLIAARSSSGRDPATWANRQIESIKSLRKMLGAKADLSVPTVALCTQISGFGLYKPIEPAEFPARRKNLLLVYIEVENFLSKKTPSGLHRTLLSVRQSLVSRDGQELWSKKDENIEDIARRQRRDFYLTIGPIEIPKSLAPGSYILKVEVEDVLAGKMNSAVAKFKLLP